MFSLPLLLLYMEKLLQAQTTFNAALLSFQNASSEQKSRVRNLEMPCWILECPEDSDKATANTPVWSRVMFFHESSSLEWCSNYIRKVMRCTGAVLVDVVWNSSGLNETGRYWYVMKWFPCLFCHFQRCCRACVAHAAGAFDGLDGQTNPLNYKWKSPGLSFGTE